MSGDMTDAALRAAAERDFIAYRALARSDYKQPRCYGMSSDALALYAVGIGPRPTVPGRPSSPGGRVWKDEECGRDYPHDEADLAACQRTFDMAPAHLRERMRPVLDEFTGWVRERRNRYGEVIGDE